MRGCGHRGPGGGAPGPGRAPWLQGLGFSGFFYATRRDAPTPAPAPAPPARAQEFFGYLLPKPGSFDVRNPGWTSDPDTGGAGPSGSSGSSASGGEGPSTRRLLQSTAQVHRPWVL